MDIDELSENFELLDDWEDKYRYLIDLGEKLPPFAEECRTDEWKVSGCQSQVWLVPSFVREGNNVRLHFAGDSDAAIVRGLIAVVLTVFDGKPGKRFCRLTWRRFLPAWGWRTICRRAAATGLARWWKKSGFTRQKDNYASKGLPMNIHEYQAKRMLSRNGIKIPKGRIAYTADEARRAAKEVTDKGPWMLKAQIQSGARAAGHFLEEKAGSRGGIRQVERLRDLWAEADAMLGSTLVTKQTGPRGKLVSRLYVEAYTRVGFTFYAGMAIDRAQASVTLLLANTKDNDINVIAESDPGRILRLPIDLVTGPTHAQTGRAAEFLKLQPRSYDSFYLFLRGLFKTFIANDALMIEINPAGVMKNGDIVALDAKITLDDKALFRHPENSRLKDDYETGARELKAGKYGFTYHEFNGSIGCIVNGEGLAMAMAELLKRRGSEVACWLNVKGGVDRDKIAAGIKIIATNPRVEGIVINILGGFVRCDLIADGIIDAAAEVGMNIPLVVRFEGTNRDEAENVLKRAGLPLTLVRNMEDAADEILRLVREGE